jgi:hypothetical protein
LREGEREREREREREKSINIKELIMKFAGEIFKDCFILI